MAGVERDGVLAVQNAYLSYHLVRRNIIRSKVHVNGYLKNDEDLNTSAHLALENHRFQQAVKALEKANDEFMDRHKHEVMQLVKTLDISDSQLHAQFQKAAGQVIVDEIRWGRIASLFFFTSILAERLIIVGQGNKVKELVKWLSLFLNNHVSHWIKAQGGWEVSNIVKYFVFFSRKSM